jgi:small-conductance mechanosensitive channel
MKRMHGRPLILLVGILFFLGAGALPAQNAGEPSQNVPVEWAPPDPADLSPDWWTLFAAGEDAELDQRFERFHALLREAVGALDAEQLLAGQALLQSIHTQYELLRVTREGADDEVFEPVPARDSYRLDTFFELRHRAADLAARERLPRLRIDELDHQASLLIDRRDALLLEYQATDPNTPQRLLLGLRLIEARLLFELIDEETAQLERRIDQIQAQRALVDQRVVFARDHLEADADSPERLEAAREEASRRQAEFGDQLAVVQNQLLTALSAPQSKPSLLALRKQQLTRASVEQALAQLEAVNLQGQWLWQRLRLEEREPSDDDVARLEEADRFVDQTRAQFQTWTTASRAMLLNPLPQDNLNAAKNMELAQAAAQETLGLLNKMDRAIDDFQQLTDLLETEWLGRQHGLRNLWSRVELLTLGVRETLSGYLDITLFHIGDVPVTFGSILKMVLILVFGWAISWFIRHLLERLKSRRQFASSPVVYTLGRLFHYIIIFIAVMAAFGSIGLDFSNFALIAGALSVGIGFGLQSVVNNFVSGLILLFEGSLRVGDYIELDTGLRGVVKEINTRATVVRTNDSIDVVVPNSQFVTNQLTNWTLREPLARFRIEFGVAYGSDKELVKEAALEAARRVDYIVHNMPSRPVEVWLTNYGDSALVFQLLAWVSKAGVMRPERVRSTVLWELETQLQERGIEIPFPQRDLHLRSGFLASEDPGPAQAT